MHMIDICQDIARDIFNDLGCGFDEPIYQKAFEVELRLRNIRYEYQKVVPVFYKGFNVGEGKLDLVITIEGGNLIVELKAIKEKVSSKEITQLRKYMQLLNIDNGLIVNFQQAGRKDVPGEPEFIILPEAHP